MLQGPDPLRSVESRVTIDRKQLPSSGEILRAVREDDFDADRYDSERAERYARGDGLY